ncbi:hypothetical protein [Cellulomonas sp.]|uniref:hypothetical protein n=1 Tax=Cellulomonas sp. TaxID=40001 RepID=UPI002812165D|nr:hypothetical protein [Cellulomonas sp.]
MHPLITHDVARAEHRERLSASSLRERDRRRASRRADDHGRPPERPQPGRRASRPHDWALTS